MANRRINIVVGRIQALGRLQVHWRLLQLAQLVVSHSTVESAVAPLGLFLQGLQVMGHGRFQLTFFAEQIRQVVVGPGRSRAAIRSRG